MRKGEASKGRQLGSCLARGLLLSILFAILGIESAHAIMSTTEIGPNRFALENEVSEPSDEAQSRPRDAHIFEEILLETRLNERGAPRTLLLLRSGDGQLLAKEGDLRQWRLRMPGAPFLRHLGDDYHRLDDLEGLSYELDEASYTLEIQASAGLFDATTLDQGPRSSTVAVPSPPGGFLNYDFHAYRANQGLDTSGLVEMGVFKGNGVGTSTFQFKDDTRGTELIRLESTWTRDMPDSRASLRMGDAVGSAGGWGRAPRFGGLQFATNFATQPNFIRFPLPAIAGEATLPSTLDLYVNGVLRLRDEVPSGPFTLNNLPIITGQGEVQVVVRDSLGREQLLTRRYYASPEILRAGLHDFSYELGKIREDYGIESNNYGRWLASGTHRWGVSDQLTAELRGEMLSGQWALGAGVAYLWHDRGVLSVTTALSDSDFGTGALLGLGFQRATSRMSYGFSSQFTNGKFSQAGLQTGETTSRRRLQAYLSWPLGDLGSLGLNYAYRSRPGDETVETLGASYNVTLGKLGFLSISALRFLGEDSQTVLGISITRPLGQRRIASARLSRDRHSRQLDMSMQQSLPVGEGYGYRVLASTLDADRLEVGVSARSGYGTYQLDAARFRGQSSFQVSASGGLALLGGKVHASRRIYDSFAVVKVGDFKGVRIYADNHEVASTRGDGTALLPRLRAYQENPIRIELADLPLGVQVGDMELEAVPYFRSGLVLEFPVRAVNGVTLTAVLDTGEYVPAGATVTQLGGGPETVTGLRGEIYLTDPMPSNQLHIGWGEHACEMTVPFAPSSEPQPYLGDFSCRRIQ